VFVGLVVGAIAGVFGGAVGVYFHMRQRRSETAFDRQLRWCEGALAAFHETGAAVAAADHASAGDTALAAECWATVVDCYEKLIPISGQRVLYATPEGDAAISEFMSSLESLIATHFDPSETDARHQPEVCLAHLREAWLALSVEARKHLALTPLGTDGLGFSRSFKSLNTGFRHPTET